MKMIGNRSSIFIVFVCLPCLTLTIKDEDDNCDKNSAQTSGVIENVENLNVITENVENLNFIEENVLYRVKREFVPYKSGKLVARQVSSALDHLLLFSGYDKRIRPQLGGPPIPVVINLSIRSMGPVDETRNAFTLDCYFRQSWVDNRLMYNATGVTELALNWAFLAKIWVPDTYIVNGKKSYLHKITVPNRFVRISPNGRVSYSQRLTIWASCPMNLKKFPLDSQVCPLVIGSFGYSADDITYKWAPSPVSIDELGMAQFSLKEYRSFENIAMSNRRTKLSFRNDSTATLEFLFERQTGFFLLQIYTPLTLIVFSSWVAFWLIRTDKGGEVAGRTALGATSVLSVVNIGFGGKSRPQVGYATALDTFIILCFITVFAALVEFACINFIDVYFKRLRDKNDAAKKAKEEEAKEAAEAKEVKIFDTEPQISQVQLAQDKNQTTFNLPCVRVVESQEKEGSRERMVLVTIQPQPSTIVVPPMAEFETGDDKDFEDISENDEKNVPEQQRCRFFKNCEIFFKTTFHNLCDKMENCVESRWGPMTELYVYNNTTEVVWTIDEYARKCFPLVFLILQFIYWTSYLYIM